MLKDFKPTQKILPDFEIHVKTKITNPTNSLVRPLSSTHTHTHSDTSRIT